MKHFLAALILSVMAVSSAFAQSGNSGNSGSQGTNVDNVVFQVSGNLIIVTVSFAGGAIEIYDNDIARGGIGAALGRLIAELKRKGGAAGGLVVAAIMKEAAREGIRIIRP